MQTPALVQGVASSIAYLRGLKPQGVYRLRVRGAAGKKPQVLAVWEDAQSLLVQRRWLTAGDSIEVKGTQDVGFGFVEGTQDEGDAEVLFGQLSGPIDVSMARGACDRLPKLHDEPEAAALAQATCGLLPKALAAQQEVLAAEREDSASEDVVAKASDRLADGHFAEATRLLEECAKKNARSCRCPMAWWRATQTRGVHATGFMARRVDACLPPEAKTGTVSPEMRRQGVTLPMLPNGSSMPNIAPPRP